MICLTRLKRLDRRCRVLLRFWRTWLVIVVTKCNAVADPQSLLAEKEALSEKVAISEYELRLAQEDIARLKAEGQKKSDCSIDKLKGTLLWWMRVHKQSVYAVCDEFFN